MQIIEVDYFAYKELFNYAQYKANLAMFLLNYIYIYISNSYLLLLANSLNDYQLKLCIPRQDLKRRLQEEVNHLLRKVTLSRVSPTYQLFWCKKTNNYRLTPFYFDFNLACGKLKNIKRRLIYT